MKMIDGRCLELLYLSLNCTIGPLFFSLLKKSYRTLYSTGTQVAFLYCLLLLHNDYIRISLLFLAHCQD